MYFQEDELPISLLNSKLPWKPMGEGQARSPRDGDSWKADLGCLYFELFFFNFPMQAQPGLELRLVHSFFDQERSSWDFTKIQDAVIAADAVYQMLLDTLLNNLQDIQKALHA